MNKTTCHTEYGRLRSVIMKRPRDGFITEEFIVKQWESLHYLAPPGFEQSCIDYQHFEDLIGRNGTEIIHLHGNDQLSLDSIYCRDASFPTDEGVILCQMGKSARQLEPEDASLIYQQMGITILGQIQPPGKLEGGDMAWIDENTLAVGLGYRTNREGIDHLKSLLSSQKIDVVEVHLPHYKGPSDVFHLMSVFSPVDHRKAVVYSPLMPVTFRDTLLQLGFTLIETPDEEFDTLGTNVLAIAPSVCIMVDGNRITKRNMEDAGCRVFVYDGTEISAKGCGGPTCLTRPVLREL